MNQTINHETIHLHFEDLATALSSVKLPCEDGPARQCEANEFMLMQITSDGTRQFKQHYTRNYLYLSAINQLSIPVGAPFHLGFFDKF